MKWKTSPHFRDLRSTLTATTSLTGIVYFSFIDNVLASFLRIEIGRHLITEIRLNVFIVLLFHSVSLIE